MQSNKKKFDPYFQLIQRTEEANLLGFFALLLKVDTRLKREKKERDAAQDSKGAVVAM